MWDGNYIDQWVRETCANGPASLAISRRCRVIVLVGEMVTSSGGCERCRGEPGRAARTRALVDGAHEIYYLAYHWRCSVCGHEWEDEDLRLTNVALAESARAIASSA